MAQFYKAKPRKTQQTQAKQSFHVSQLDHLGAGIAEHQGKIVFIPGALPGETVTAQITEQKKRHAKAKLIKVETASEARIAPSCPYYGRCGGCDLQHLELSAQRDAKQAALENLINKMGCTQPQAMSEPLSGEGWHYRRRARLATQYQRDSKRLNLGFRALASSEVVNIDACPVLAKSLSDLIAPLNQCLNRLSAKRSLGHVELLSVDSGPGVVLRITSPLNDKDKALLAAFGEQHGVRVILLDDESRLETLWGDEGLPFYRLEDGSQLSFSPGNFIQVNGEINQQMVTQAIDWLQVQPGERVLDLFCGVGNFTLPLAEAGAQVVGVEGVETMVAQARLNAGASGVEGVEFYHGDLSADLSGAPWLGRIDKLLLDPARAGAYESLQWLKKMKPKAIVYISCNPVSLARDCEPLLAQGYVLSRLGLIDMFPQTHHIEAMALFELGK
ncbi:23S rRNA (uracil(1939)-C(5))-methyltransferase RlmD [Shewanella aquimarina]|uniref:23S rRNA (uracil(1939)-C(5))-methyltransferase RlmD n=1 Tax=Shewanella aquimarina TaxID=260365 RepID=UPI002014EF7C|nr:23S rRNA (uracil(1939)-C(5))-methyltransferase RlmD [Shewanella aquimarina]MCL2910483.1 23S rRNA (uracil(1939)-C(5))-methyltransferase RlmD [Shewanella aquimarina]